MFSLFVNFELDTICYNMHAMKNEKFNKSKSNEQQQPAWKQAPYAVFIESNLNFLVWIGLQNNGQLPDQWNGLALWVDWLAKEGYQLNSDEVVQKAAELMGDKDNPLGF